MRNEQPTISLAKWAQDSIRSAGWAPAVVFVVHVAVSRVLGWYQSAPWLDVPMHFAGGVAIAYFFARSVSIAPAERAFGAVTPLGAAVLVLLLVCASTVSWEFAEWTTDRLRWTQAQGGLDDTMSDMLIGIAGGAAYLSVSRWLFTSLEPN